jgi:hypothetical protein
MLANGVDIGFLCQTFRSDNFFPRRNKDGIEENVLEVGFGISLENANGVIDIGRIEGLTRFQQLIKFRQQLSGKANILLITQKMQIAPFGSDPNIQRLLNLFQVFILIAEQAIRQFRIS